MESTTDPAAPVQTLLWDQSADRRALDQLFFEARQFRTGKAFDTLIAFVSRFRFYSPYNAMLVHIQMPHARFVAPAYKWRTIYGRSVKPAARPLIILQPMGPVMFVFDVSDTEPIPDLPEDFIPPKIPTEVTAPFTIKKGTVKGELDLTCRNAVRDGIRISYTREGAASGGSIRTSDPRLYQPLKFPVGDKIHPIPVNYDLFINQNLEETARYAILVHELAHLYCGHLGTPNSRWWPDRQGRPHHLREIEAESVAHLVCGRLDIRTSSAKYLSAHVRDDTPLPDISLECIMKVAGQIEQMGRKRLPLRKS